MIHSEIKTINLEEQLYYHFLESEIPRELGKLLWRKYRNYIEIDPPSFKNDDRWGIKNKGWVGRILLDRWFEINLSPRFDIENVFAMLEYAYDIDSKRFKFTDGLANCSRLDEFYEIIANTLAKNILDRGRRGFYRAYKHESSQLPYIRGRLDINNTILRPWEIKPQCNYEEHTFDVIENQILLWTIQRILHSGLCTERSLPQIRRAYRTLQGLATPVPCNPNDCVKRFYNRLNFDYEPLHGLCRFFLEQSGPTHKVGERTIQPFLVDMPYLYELFVTKWLEVHKSYLPPEYSIKAKKRASIGQGKKVNFEIDLVLYKNGKAYCVFDTKYKMPDEIKKDDFNQVVTYAALMDCHNAFLIYPKLSNSLVDAPLPGGDIRVRTLTFSLSGDLNKSGKEFIENLLYAI